MKLRVYHFFLFSLMLWAIPISFIWWCLA